MMLHIALCDDEAEQLQITRQMLEDFLSEYRLAARVREFASGPEMLNAVAENGPFDLYILDIVMPEMSGIYLGLELRKTDHDGVILYLTTSPDFALESYQARAFFYLLKPVTQETLFPILNEAVCTLNKRQEDGIQVKTHDGIMRILFDSILYAELKNRSARYYLRDGSYVDSMTATSSFRDMMAPLLQDPRFLLCGASFLVNLHYIKMVDKFGAVLSDGRKLNLPTTACTALRGAWSDYWLEGGHSK